MTTKTTSEQQEKTEQARLDFFNNISHELRTPINGIIGHVEILNSQITDPDHQESLASIQGCALSLLNLINSVIDQTMYNAGELTPSLKPFRLKTLVSDIQKTCLPDIKDKGLKFSINIQPNTPEWLTSDNEHIKQIIVNILNNAIKFTEEGHINLSLIYDHDSELLSIAIKDTGIGIEDDFKDKLFESFEQADTSVKRQFGGLGLGLSVAQALTNLLNGKIHFETTLKEGTTFFIEIPTKEPDSSELKFLSEEEFIDDEHHNPLNQFDTKNMKLLIVEDNHVNQVMMKQWVSRMGFGIINIANNGFETLSLLRHNEYDIILMDCQMPQLDGYETTSLIRDMEKNLDTAIPIIAVTANASPDEREKCLSFGMNDYLAKPTNFTSLRDTIAKWLYNNSSMNQQAPSIPTVVKDSVDDNYDEKSDTEKTSPIDMEVINDFTEGDINLERQIANLFVEKGWENVEKLMDIKNPEQQDDWKMVAHSLKGAAANIGAIPLTHICQKAEDSYECPSNEKDILLERIKHEFEIVRDFFEKRAS